MVYNINWFMNTYKSDARCWVLTFGVLLAVRMFGYAVSAPIVSIRPTTSVASHIQLKVNQQLATPFKAAKKIKIWFN